MVDAIGESQRSQSALSSIAEHKITPWLLGCLTYLAANLLDTMQNDDADLQQTVNDMALKIAVIEERTKQLADNAPNAGEIDRRFEEHNRRLEMLEKTK